MGWMGPQPHTSAHHEGICPVRQGDSSASMSVVSLFASQTMGVLTICSVSKSNALLFSKQHRFKFKYRRQACRSLNIDDKPAELANHTHFEVTS